MDPPSQPPPPPTPPPPTPPPPTPVVDEGLVTFLGTDVWLVNRAYDLGKEKGVISNDGSSFDAPDFPRPGDSECDKTTSTGGTIGCKIKAKCFRELWSENSGTLEGETRETTIKIFNEAVWQEIDHRADSSLHRVACRDALYQEHVGDDPANACVLLGTQPQLDAECPRPASYSGSGYNVCVKTGTSGIDRLVGNCKDDFTEDGGGYVNDATPKLSPLMQTKKDQICQGSCNCLFLGHCDDPVLVTCVSSLVDGCREYASQRDPGDVGYGPMRYCDEATFATALTSDVGQLATLIQKYRYAEHKIGDAESKCVSLKLCDDPDNPPDDFYDNFKKTGLISVEEVAAAETIWGVEDWLYNKNDGCGYVDCADAPEVCATCNAWAYCGSCQGVPREAQPAYCETCQGAEFQTCFDNCLAYAGCPPPGDGDGRRRRHRRRELQSAHYSRVGYTLPLNARVSHAYVKVNVEVCCFAQDGGPADNLLHACLTDGAADTADDLLADAADAVSRCTILELPENEKNGGCDNNSPGATDACEFVEAAALIELAAGTTGGGVLVFGYPSSDHGIKIKKAEAYDCDAAGACCPGPIEYDASGNAALTAEEGEAAAAAGWVPWWALLLVALVLLVVLGVVLWQLLTLKRQVASARVDFDKNPPRVSTSC